jgi:hypothetical protein
VSFLHSAFGFAIEADREVPGLSGFRRDARSPVPDIKLHFEMQPSDSSNESEELFYTSSFLDAAGRPSLRIWNSTRGSLSRLAYSDGHQFWIDRSGTEVWAMWPRSSSFEEALSYLLGPVFGVLLRYRGVTCLHASAAALDGFAVAFVGDAGAGKSTTAAALAAKGWTVLADDIVALEERSGVCHVSPAFPFLSLWPESSELIYGDPEALPRSTPVWEKRRLSLDSHSKHFSAEPLPLKAVYLLAGASGTGQACIEPIPRQDALIQLVANSYGSKILDRERRAREFEVLGRLLSKATVRRLFAREYPPELDRLSRLISADFQALVIRP